MEAQAWASIGILGVDSRQRRVCLSSDIAPDSRGAMFDIRYALVVLTSRQMRARWLSADLAGHGRNRAPASRASDATRTASPEVSLLGATSAARPHPQSAKSSACAAPVPKRLLFVVSHSDATRLAGRL